MEEERRNLKVEGMTCNHCASTVLGIIKQEGGGDIHVDYLMGEANFDLKNAQKMDKILKRLESAGYKSNAEGSENQSQGSLSDIEKKFLFTLPFSLTLFSHMFAPHDWLINNIWVQFFLCLPVFMMGLYHFGRSTFESIKSGHINMDILILIGSSSAFFYSIYGAITHYGSAEVHDFLFFETTSTIITLVLLGYVIEHKAVQRTTTILRDLYKTQPEKAKKLVQNGLNQDLEVVNASSLVEHDIILVNTGDRIPADGMIIHGTLTLDEAMLTGESEHLQKEKGQEVFSGSLIVDGNGTLKVTKTGKESTIGKIIELVKQSRSDKPSVQKLADKISSIFVPTILILSSLTFIINYTLVDTGMSDAILRSIAVLVIACPCAMGLATPTAVSVGLGLAAKLGIIVKKASVFEEVNAIKTIVFDKTGTLTSGDLQISMNDLADGYDQELVWGIIKSLELRSNHPIAHRFLSLTDHISETPLENIEEVKGRGLKARYKSMNAQFGSAEFTGVSNSDADLFLTLDDKLITSFSVTDELKSDASDTIKFFTKKNLNTTILSGDSHKKTASIAQLLNITDFKGGQLPEDKLAELKHLKERTKVAMVGDGVNDSPALALADVGISIGNSNALAVDSAKVVIVGNKLELLQQLFKISDKVVLTIKQNLFWAFAYNLVAIPLAAAGYLDPMLAALSMAFSDVIVIGNSLRLKMILPNSIR
mgnify:FL=1